MTQVVKHQSFRDVAIASHGGGGQLMPQTFGDVVSFSEIMARSQHAIPKHLRDVPGACMAVTMQALRWSMDPFAVASKSYNVKDIIAYEAQLIAAVVHTRAPLKTRPNYTYAGEGTDRRCTVSAMFDDGIERSYESPRIGDIAVKNSPLWKSDPDQQLGYFSIRSFARRYCPEVILGVYTPEEAEQFRGPDNAKDVTPSLADRLTAAKRGEGSIDAAADGFSVQHVISEIDGTDSNSSQCNPASSPTETDKPASDVIPIVSDAGTNSQSPDNPTPRSGEEGERAGVQQGETAAGPPLPEGGARFLPAGWQKDLVKALQRAQKPASLKSYAQQFFDKLGAFPSDPSDIDTAKAIRSAFEKNFGNAKAIDAELRELI